MEALGKQQQKLNESEKHSNNNDVPKTAKLATKSLLGKRHHSLYANLTGFEAEGVQKNGTDYGFLVRQNSELLRALDDLEKTCSTLKEENGLLRKSSAPGTEEKVRRLRKKNTELAVLAKRLEERARKLQEANLRVNSPSLMRPGSAEHYKRAFARQRARDLAHHADALLSKDKEIAALQQECRELEAQLGHSKIRVESFLSLQERELNNKRKECEDFEHEVKKRQRRCLDLARAENEELREELSEVTAQRNSVLEENQRLRAKLENLEQVLKHMREVAERRQQLELEHEQALAILKFKQDEIKRLQRAQLFAKREHEGVVQMLESKVRELEEKCRNQSEQFGLLSQELEKFRLQASKVDLATSRLTRLTRGLCCCPRTRIILFLSFLIDVAAALRMGATPHPAGLTRVERSPVTKHRELPTISVSKSRRYSPFPLSSQVDTASEVEELDIDVASAPYTASRGAAKLQVFIARYSYNPYDGPNDNPEVELPLTAGEYIYVYGDMDDDGFYEGPPDAPLDVQLEQGPSPGIALISWLPVTIDAAGTSNGVRVTGYSIYVDRKKVLEVSSPTAGSALLGPSQMQCLQAAQELTLRTMSSLF
uniref:Peripheral-type benzodiazepine receptor-associated protein 1 n=1 Tax=Oryzias sinensis TaxID=183150 RepID=A0A8C7YRZ4_9TELE